MNKEHFVESLLCLPPPPPELLSKVECKYLEILAALQGQLSLSRSGDNSEPWKGGMYMDSDFRVVLFASTSVVRRHSASSPNNTAPKTVQTDGDFFSLPHQNNWANA